MVGIAARSMPLDTRVDRYVMLFVVGLWVGAPVSFMIAAMCAAAYQR
jgi:hypothetical protein